MSPRRWALLVARLGMAVAIVLACGAGDLHARGASLEAGALFGLALLGVVLSAAAVPRADE